MTRFPYSLQLAGKDKHSIPSVLFSESRHLRGDLFIFNLTFDLKGQVVVTAKGLILVV